MDFDEVLEVALLAEDQSVADELEALSEDAFARKSVGFNGLDTIVVAFTHLSGPLIEGVTRIVLEQIQARKHVKLRFGDTVVEGISEAKALALLERLARDAEKQR